MRTRAKALFQSLSARLLLPLLGIVSLVLAAYAALNLGSTHKRFLELAGAEADRCSRLILRATHDRMLLDPQVDVQRMVEQLAESGRISTIRIYDASGRITQSTQPAEIGWRVDRGQQPCITCHARGQPAARLVRHQDFLAQVAGRPALRHLALITNEPSCSSGSCHTAAAGQPLLGVLDVELSMEPLQQALLSARRHTLWTMAVLVVVAGAVSAGLIRRLVHRPVRQLYQGTQRIARGDLDTRIDVPGGHELARLAESFNRMAADVKAARQEVTDWSRRLEEKVLEKSEQLRRTQRQVVHMERMASLGKLAATVAHELNNPISGILACARLVERELQDQPLPEELRRELMEDLRLIAQESGRCGTIVRNLLLFARGSGGGGMAAVEVGPLVERALMLVRHHLEINGIRLDWEPPAGPASIVADGAQVEQALLALLVNAVEAMSSGGEKGGVLTVRVEADAEAVTLHVGDTGPGIPEEVLPRIFEPFFSTKNKESGVGLGLAVVYGIVQRHGGRIDVDSQPGQGATFHLWLPRRPPAGEDPGAA